MPPTDLTTGKPFAPPGPFDMRVPRLHSYYGSLRLPSLILLGSCLSPSCTTRVFAVSLLAGTESLYPQARRILVRLLQRRSIRGGRSRASQVPGQPQCQHALLSDPGGTKRARLPLHVRTAFRSLKDVGSHNKRCFVAQSHGLLTHCLRFTLTVTGPGARLASGWLPTFTGWDSHPLGCTTQFPKLSLLSKHPGFPGALRPNV
jgi:hypothetical protein